jgi:hypothetical protein
MGNIQYENAFGLPESLNKKVGSSVSFNVGVAIGGRASCCNAAKTSL